tara:strand:- start:355 stop:1011 length:657 start_codon:yes stop_codon:yes gene_type:complete
MKKIVVRKNENYTVISNIFLRDIELSLKAKGLLAYLLSLPNDWSVYATELANRHKDGITSIYSALNELEQANYLIRERLREKGKLKGVEYIVSETPILEKPNLENLKQENLNLENQTLLNTNNNKILIKENTNYIYKWQIVANELGFDDLENFIDYWTEKSPRGKKMRFEKQSTFDVKRRMQRWMKNSFNTKNKSSVETILTDYSKTIQDYENGKDIF